LPILSLVAAFSLFFGGEHDANGGLLTDFQSLSILVSEPEEWGSTFGGEQPA